MSDTSSAPPKPKPGSLRDRIAAFEKSASAPTTGPAPVVRPKPAGFAAWKPKVPSPPSSPSAGTTEQTSSSPKAGRMSASDAKESITKGGSLKDRMAALQGKGAFGAPPPVAAKPAVEKPKWRPPPVLHAPVDNEDHHVGESSSADIAVAVERTISSPTFGKSQGGVVRVEGEETAPPPLGIASGEDNSADAASEDPVEEERQRRAAIAARMARLGGARLGMAPPVLGKKPPVRRPTREEIPKTEESKADEEEPNRDVSSSEAVKPAEMTFSATSPENLLTPPPTNAIHTAEETQSEARKSPEYFPTRKNSENASILSSESTESHPARSPALMPVPSVPRRTGPPRKKPVKPTAPPPEVPEEETPATGVVGGDEEASPYVIDQPKGESVAESVEMPRDDLLTDVQELKAKVQNQTTKSSVDQPLVIPEANLPSPPVAEEAVPISTSPITPSRSISVPESSRPPPPSLATTEDKASKQIAVENGEDDGGDRSPKIAEGSTTSPFPVLTSPRDAIVKPEIEATVEYPVVSEGDITEEEARKKRVAERLAKMGAFNPFAIPPPPTDQIAQEISRSPPPVPVAFVPSPPSVPSSTVQDRAPVVPLSFPEPLKPVRRDSTTETNADEDEDTSDEDDDEDEVFDNEPVHATNKYVEKPSPLDELLERPNIPVRPPVPLPATRSPVRVQQFEPEDDSGSEYDDDSIPNTPAPSIPVNQPTTVTSTPKPFSPPERPIQPPRRIVPQAPEEVEMEEEELEGDTDEEADERLAQSQSHLFIPPPTGRVPGAIPPNRRHLQDEEDGNGSENDSPALPILHRKSLEVPAGRLNKVPYAFDDSESYGPESDHDGQALPIPPRHTSVPPPPRVVPPPPPAAVLTPEAPPLVHRSLPPAPATASNFLATSPPYIPRTLSVSSEEILDEEEGDPIDPAFHSPSRRGSTINLQPTAQAQSEPLTQVQMSTSPPAPAKATSSFYAPAEQERTDELRRNTIAERMAKLGGIKFGAAPLHTPASRPSLASRPPPSPQQSNEEQERTTSAETKEQPTDSDEEERARKERIAAKMASMGGMRIGMMPVGMGGFPPQRSQVLKEENIASPLPRAVPPSRPPPPPAQLSQVPDSDSDYGSATASEDGIKVEAEESELEEVNYEDAEEPEEEAPPPVPSRGGRPALRQSSVDQSTPPPLPPSRPPIPTSVPARRSSIQTTESIVSPSPGYNTSGNPQRSSAFVPSNQSEYVMVEEPESQEAPPPPPPSRPGRLPPTRSTPQVLQAPTMQSSEGITESISSQWELPSIPTSTFDFGRGTDLSLSWTDAAEPTSPATSLQRSVSTAPSKRATLPSERQLSADDLIALWGRIGVQVCEIATSMFEKSKKTLIGDGTYAGFVGGVVATVPNAAPVPTASGEYGYLVYVQNGPLVQKRASEIMPGDIVEIHDAKFKGHKGLQTYHQNVGAAGENLVGVVGEFEAKKSKIRVFHANQHVGQQTVESVSYRLEDLKSGIVKVYRVLEA